MGKTYKSIDSVCKDLGLSPKEVQDFIREGIVDIEQDKPGELSSEQIERLRMGKELQKEFGVNLAGVDIILNMRSRIEELQKAFDDLEQAVREKSDEA